MAQRLCFGERSRIEAMRETQLSVDEIAEGWIGTGPRCIESWTAAAGSTVTVRVQLTGGRAMPRLGPTCSSRSVASSIGRG